VSFEIESQKNSILSSSSSKITLSKLFRFDHVCLSPNWKGSRQV